MPKVRHRVNSLTEEREQKTVNSRKTSHFDSFIAQIVKNHPTKKNFSIGMIGLADVEKLISIILLQQNSMLDTRLYVKVFEADFSVIEQTNLDLKARLNNLCDKSTGSNLESDLERLAALKQLSATELISIPGCQRLILNRGQCVIDLYVGDIQTNLSHTLAPKLKDAFIDAWLHLSDSLDESLLWQMAKFSSRLAPLFSSNMNAKQIRLAQLTGFTLSEPHCSTLSSSDEVGNEIAEQERRALRQAQADTFLHYPQFPAKGGEIAVIGGGIASTHLALSLAERHKTVRLFCQDNGFSQQASGNKQGAIYPLLTPDNGTLSQYYQQGLLFSRRRLIALVDEGYNIANQLCGVLHTGHDERSRGRLDRIISAQAWPKDIAHSVNANQASQLAGIEIDKDGVFYPLGGWISPPEFTQAAFDKAAQISDVSALFNCNIVRIEQRENAWYLYQSPSEEGGNEIEHGPFATLVLANGHGLTQFEQTKLLPATGFRGQVSHIPARNELAKLNTVLCSHGYLTPSNNQLHCTGASYVKDPKHLDYCPNEQLDNLKKMQHSYEGKSWVDDIDISGHSARVGVRMVTRDHAPMMGCAPDLDVILEQYQQHQHTKESITFWKGNPAPVHEGLFILGGLGSRGITSGPLAAEALAAQLCGEVLPLDMTTLAMLNPNRMLMRKLIKGKAL
ncbi:FAD-dependent 5-carboxymethylaminomethyl-2-thiouridine(34) oxidoreductase MnmC [Shewanella eurypsychrophilus]|uniref:tRNA 5-methylaminomethyl-2-thiouridine biosynthesis bifunctional protein MnmC n=1 Tax=Shewanella eurypsychrophilus TaxID=2593656 RepID=A0ABX6V797_9GAMM|nr:MULTISPECIES: FAD-dependent 5-carboxymethylaminomethyl-2-thiouridine(34) oxidoreductase MnmC [Shewanella]QFU22155.1 FAD-dependent 5-carboxymethylaminomethyl-2-thiouridine(34) oxidoreductase MnmC [Shewanella sp. YLB-09]QPG57442.1 FAD-dependent 5-carboxymethylaminomethyl-2-thiouridine(34) oxidoreductase MnmC [Shewanella eurypsychrophilus]